MYFLRKKYTEMSKFLGVSIPAVFKSGGPDPRDPPPSATPLGGGTGRNLPLRTPLIIFPGWNPGDPIGICNENGPFLLLLDCFSAFAIVV